MAEERTPASELQSDKMTEEQVAAFIGQAAWNVLDRFSREHRLAPNANQLGGGILEIMAEYGYEIVRYEK